MPPERVTRKGISAPSWAAVEGSIRGQPATGSARRSAGRGAPKSGTRRQRGAQTGASEATIPEASASEGKLGGLDWLVENLGTAALLVDAGNATIRFVNASAAAMFGYAPPELVGAPIGMLLPERFRQRHTGLMANANLGSGFRRMAGAEPVAALRKDGTEFLAEISLSPLTTAGGSIIAVVRDVAAESGIERALAESEGRYLAVVSALKECVLLVQEDGSFEACNPAARELLRLDAGLHTISDLPRGWKLVTADGSPLDPITLVRNLAAAGTRQDEHVIGLVRSRARVIWLEVSMQTLDEQSSARGVVITFTDISGRRIADEALRRSEEYLRERTADLERANSQLAFAAGQLAEAHAESVLLLSAAAEAHDHTTGAHLLRVRKIAEALAQEMGYSPLEAAELGLAAVLHDIGKIRVPESILSRATTLRSEQWEIMKQHTVWGAEFLSTKERFFLAAQIARSHHERWDGMGYPDGLRGEEIPEEVTIVTVADSFDAMTSHRPYRQAWPIEQAVAEIQACAGKQFSPRAAAALVRLVDQGLLGVHEGLAAA